MKLIKLLTLLILFSLNVKSQCKDSIYVPFTNTTPTQGGTWATNSITFGDSTRCGGTTNSCALSKPYYVEFNGLGDYIRTPLITQSSTFAFWYKRSTNNTGHRVIIETSPDNTNWTTRLQITSITTVYQRASISANNVYVRIRDQRDSTTSTRLWYLDDISWSWDKAGFIWNGSVSSDWQNPANWCKGVLPTSTDSVIIPTGTSNNPVISNGVAVCRDITLNTGTQLTIQNARLQVYGKINSNSQINSLNGIVELAGSSAQTISGSLFSNKVIGLFVISNYNGVSITSDTLKIKKELLFDAYNCVLNTNGYLYLLSSDSITARIGDMTSCRIIGDVTVERFVPNHPAKWQFLSVPTTGQTINQSWQEGNSPTGNTKPRYGTAITSNQTNALSLGFDAVSPGGPSMKWYNDATGTYVGVPNTNALIQTNTGYMVFVRGDRSILVSSTPATSTTLRTKGVIYSPIDNPPPVINVQADTFQSVNNFYASSIDFNNINKTGGVQNVFYLWDPSLNGLYGVGAFQTFVWNGSSYTITPGGGNYSSGNTNIPSGSAFFVRASGTTGTLQLTEACKTGGSDLVLRQGGPNTKSLSTNLLYDTANSLIDGVVSIFDDSYSNGVGYEDAIKIYNSQGISIWNGGRKISGDLRKPNPKDTIQLSIYNLRNAGYRFSVKRSNSESGELVYLNDKFTGKKTLIQPNSTTNIGFSITADIKSKDPFRFYYSIERKLLINNVVADIFPMNGWIDIYPNPTDQSKMFIQLNDIESGEYKLWLLNTTTGIRVFEQKIYHQPKIINHSIKLNRELSTGAYIAVIEAKDGVFYTTQLFIE